MVTQSYEGLEGLECTLRLQTMLSSSLWGGLLRLLDPKLWQVQLQTILSAYLPAPEIFAVAETTLLEKRDHKSIVAPDRGPLRLLVILVM